MHIPHPVQTFKPGGQRSHHFTLPFTEHGTLTLRLLQTVQLLLNSGNFPGGFVKFSLCRSKGFTLPFKRADGVLSFTEGIRKRAHGFAGAPERLCQGVCRRQSNPDMQIIHHDCDLRFWQPPAHARRPPLQASLQISLRAAS